MQSKAYRAAVWIALVATPAAPLHAQSNPWYIPPPQQQQMVAPANPYQQGQPQIVYQQAPQAYQPQPSYQLQPGLGAGYVIQPQQQPQAAQIAPQMIVPNITYGATTGALPPQQLQTAPSYPVAPQGPFGGNTQGYAAPQVVIVPQFAPADGAASYRAVPQQPYQLQPYGNYPPLGSDPTLSSKSAEAPQQPAAAPELSSTSTPQYVNPGFAGPTTLTPGYGGPLTGTLSPYPMPLGMSPYGALPFY